MKAALPLLLLAAAAGCSSVHVTSRPAEEDSAIVVMVQDSDDPKSFATDCTVHIRGEAIGEARLPTTEGRPVVLKHLAPGTYTVGLSGPDRTYTDANVKLGANEHVTVRFSVSPDSRLIRHEGFLRWPCTILECILIGSFRVGLVALHVALQALSHNPQYGCR